MMLTLRHRSETRSGTKGGNAWSVDQDRKRIRYRERVDLEVTRCGYSQDGTNNVPNSSKLRGPEHPTIRTKWGRKTGKAGLPSDVSTSIGLSSRIQEPRVLDIDKIPRAKSTSPRRPSATESDLRKDESNQINSYRWARKERRIRTSIFQTHLVDPKRPHRLHCVLSSFLTPEIHIFLRCNIFIHCTSMYFQLSAIP